MQGKPPDARGLAIALSVSLWEKTGLLHRQDGKWTHQDGGCLTGLPHELRIMLALVPE